MNGDFVNGALHNDVVLRNLFSIIDVELLKTCREVCKTWRDVMDPIFKARVAISFKILSGRISPVTVPSLATSSARRHSQLVDKLWNFDLTMKEHCSVIPFTAFKLEGTKFSWTCLLMHNFFRTYGSQMRKLTINLFYQSDPTTNFFKCLYVISKYATELEVLQLRLISDKQIMVNRSKKHYKKLLNQPEVLNKLKRFAFYYQLKNTNEQTTNMLAGAIKKIISFSKSLIHYEINSPLTLLTSKAITRESIRSLKYLSAVQVCMYKNSNLGINESVFEVLLDYSKIGLKLEELYVEFWVWEEDHRNLTKKFQLFWQFLKSQSNSLKILKISVACQCSKPLRWHFPTFPKMENLEKLTIIYDDPSGHYFNFQDRDLGIPFPHLKTILFSYKTFMGNNVIRTLLNTFERAGDELTSVRIIETYLITRYFFDFDFMSGCRNHYREAKLKIPNLKSFQIFDKSTDTTRIASYNGSRENSYQIF